MNNVTKKRRKPVSKKARHDLWLKYEGRCAYCGKQIPFEEMEVDHITPRIKGGEDCYPNYAPSCHECNMCKSDKSVEEFRQFLETIKMELEKRAIYNIALRYGMIEEKENHIAFYFERS